MWYLNSLYGAYLTYHVKFGKFSGLTGDEWHSIHVYKKFYSHSSFKYQSIWFIENYIKFIDIFGYILIIRMDIKLVC